MEKKHVDYIPTKDKDLAVFGKNFRDVVFDNVPKWSITEAEYTALSTAVTNFNSAVDKAYGPDRTKAITVRKNAARKELVKQIRSLVNFRLRNPIVTDEDRTELGLPLHDGTRTKIEVPTTYPTMTIKGLLAGQLSVHFHEEEIGSKDDKPSHAIPYGIDGAVIIYDVLPEPPTALTQLTRHNLATHTPFLFNFSMAERGKTAYFAIAWQNEKGEKGPFSPILSDIIP